jgi:hypothetical protein
VSFIFAPNATTQFVIKRGDHAAREYRVSMALAGRVGDELSPTVHRCKGNPDDLASLSVVKQLAQGLYCVV